MIKGNRKPGKVIFVDVDGTLILGGKLNGPLVRWIKARREEGFEIVLWSANGEAYANKVACDFEVLDLFDKIISKPSYVVDDQGWQWTKYTRVVALEDIRVEGIH